MGEGVQAPADIVSPLRSARRRKPAADHYDKRIKDAQRGHIGWDIMIFRIRFKAR